MLRGLTAADFAAAADTIGKGTLMIQLTDAGARVICNGCGTHGRQYCADRACSRIAQHTGDHVYPAWMLPIAPCTPVAIQDRMVTTCRNCGHDADAHGGFVPSLAAGACPDCSGCVR